MAKNVIDANIEFSFLPKALRPHAEWVREPGGSVRIRPFELEPGEEIDCPFYGIGIDCDLTVEKFLEWKREERAAEYERDLRT